MTSGNQLAACLMFKDSADYLEEWLCFHEEVGVDHFYLYDNESSDDYLSVIRPFVRDGKITLHRWPGVGQMLPVFEHCLETYRHRNRWMVFLDDDEFLFPAEEEDLPTVLRRYSEFAGVTVCWLLFGSSGFQTRPPGLVTHNYRLRAAEVNRHGKCIVQPQKVTKPWVLGHAFHRLPGETIADENFEPVHGLFPDKPSSKILCLNHYVSKSTDEMRRKRSRLPACADKYIYTLEDYEIAEAGFNEVEDLRIQRFADRLRWRFGCQSHFRRIERFESEANRR